MLPLPPCRGASPERPSAAHPNSDTNTAHLGLERGLLLLQPPDGFHQHRDLSERQESSHVRGAHGHHPAILIQHLPERDTQRPPDSAARFVFQRHLLWFASLCLIFFRTLCFWISSTKPRPLGRVVLSLRAGAVRDCGREAGHRLPFPAGSEVPERGRLFKRTAGLPSSPAQALSKGLCLRGDSPKEQDKNHPCRVSQEPGQDWKPSSQKSQRPASNLVSP